MTLTEFLFLLDLHGAELSRWPTAAQAPAQRLIATSPEAAHALAQARRLDALLRAEPIEDDDPAVARVLARVRGGTREARSQLWVALRSWGLAPLWPRVSVLIAALVLGLIAGAHVQELRRAQTASLTQLVWPSYAGERLLDGVR